VIWLIAYTAGLPVQILEAYSYQMVARVIFVVFMLYLTSSYTSSITAVVCISFIKRKSFLEVIESISEVDNKIRYTPQEETYINRNVMFNIISNIILLTVVPCVLIVYIIHQFINDEYNMFNLTIIIIMCVNYICNILILFQFLNLVFMVKQRYSHLKKDLTNWINGTVSRPTSLTEEYERCSRSARNVDHIIITPLHISSFGKIEGTLNLADIHLLRQILVYSELYDITCLIRINDTISCYYVLDVNMCFV